MMERLEESKNLEAAERQKLEDEIRAKQEEVKRIQSEVDIKDEETKRLQMEVEEARQKQEEANRQLLAVTSTPTHHHVEENDHDDDDNMPNGDVTKDLETDSTIVDPVEERRTMAEKSGRLHDQLKVKLLIRILLFIQNQIDSSIVFFILYRRYSKI